MQVHVKEVFPEEMNKGVGKKNKKGEKTKHSMISGQIPTSALSCV